MHRPVAMQKVSIENGLIENRALPFYCFPNGLICTFHIASIMRISFPDWCRNSCGRGSQSDLQPIPTERKWFYLQEMKEKYAENCAFF